MNFHQKLYLYSWLNNFPWLQGSYIAKIMLVAFLGTHIPLLTLLCWFVISQSSSLDMVLQVLLVALIATLLGTVCTLYAIYYLLMPVILTSASLRDYLNKQALPQLPTKFVDEMGMLMANSSKTIHQLDDLINHITNYNSLTGLPNQNLFCERFRQVLSSDEHKDQLIAIILLAIDNFTLISQRLEQDIVNFLLREIAQRVTNCIKGKDILAHLNTDEFVVAQIGILSLESAISLAQLLQSTLAKPFYINGEQIYISASLGITIHDIKDHQAEQLLQEVYIALHQAKQRGRNQYQFYSPEMNVQLQERLRLESDLYQVLEYGQLLVYYQPIVDLNNKQVIAMEALVRWQHPQKGLIFPGQFIPIAEANDLIVPMGEWILRTACAQNQEWLRAGVSPIRISVNLSGKQFEQPNLVDMIQDILHETRLEPHYLELEVTESFLLNNIQRSVKILEQLRELGIVLALDDFGTGYSSLSYLKQLPVNILKIDRSFVQDITSNPDSAIVTDAIIALAKSLRLKITAEGIETVEQMHYLEERYCDEGQGYYFSKPLPREKIFPMLNQIQNK